MDPDTTLAELRKLTNRALDGLNPPEPEELAELFSSLDGLASGGFLPRAWTRNP